MQRSLLLLGLLGLSGCSDEQSLANVADAYRIEGAHEPIHVLVLTATHGYRHETAIARSRELLKALEPVTEFRFTLTEDIDALSAETLSAHDVIFFNNSTLRAARLDGPTPGWRDSVVEQPVTRAHQQALIEFLERGGGVVSAHSGLDALYGWPEYRALLGGGLFEAHPWTEQVTVRVEDRTHPLNEGLEESFEIRDEIYVLDRNPRPEVQVLTTLDLESVDASLGKRNDYPLAWSREHRGARVFVTKLGHFPEVWTHPAFLRQLLAGLRYAAGR
ncbi:MAG: ThuA domain-containing protein [Pseudomonadota bacterium]